MYISVYSCFCWQSFLACLSRAVFTAYTPFLKNLCNNPNAFEENVKKNGTVRVF